VKADVFLSTRLKSTRLPGKSLLKIKGKTVTDHLIDRIKAARRPSEIILCTSTNPKDDPLVEIAKNNGILHFRGSEEDKLDRYLNAAKEFGTDFIVVVDGDDIFCEPSFIDMCISEFGKSNADYVTVAGAPVGAVPFCMKRQALEKACRLKNETDTEIWGSCFIDSGLFKTSFINPDAKLQRPDIRLTLDYREDFMLIEVIFESLYKPGRIFTLLDIIRLLDRNPELVDINRQVQKLYLEHQRLSPKVTLKKERLS
jgi:spore coat polysaccharide biosynthesis protein SpsF